METGNRMNADILVSVVIPVYDVENYLKFTLNDVISQTYKNIEIIVIDDGSTDNSGLICDEFEGRDKRISVFHTQNKGLSAARNKGIEVARGQFIYFLDSDDRIHRRTIEILLEIAKSCSADIVQAGTFAFVDDSALPIDADKNLQFIELEKKGMCEAMLNGKIAGATIIQNKLYRRNLFNEINMRFPVGRIHEDVALGYKLYWKANKIIVLDNPLFYYRSKRKGSITHSPFSLARLDALIACEERYIFFENEGEKKLFALALMNWCENTENCIKQLKKSNICGKQEIIHGLEKKLESNYFRMIKLKEVKIKSKLRIGLGFIICKLA
jgi:glycosyltransferase involved in cell wall biosynthesis